jgi:NAD-dependent dihydropyrimidine dehydrogenase PreA subunit
MDVKKSMYQSEHEKYNEKHYPGTRQICIDCGDPTERCEDDAIYIDNYGPLCIDCYNRIIEEEGGQL